MRAILFSMIQATSEKHLSEDQVTNEGMMRVKSLSRFSWISNQVDTKRANAKKKAFPYQGIEKQEQE